MHRHRGLERADDGSIEIKLENEVALALRCTATLWNSFVRRGTNERKNVKGEIERQAERKRGDQINGK